MTPRTRIRFLDEDLAVPELMERFRTHRHPRVPVFREHHDNIERYEVAIFCEGAVCLFP